MNWHEIKDRCEKEGVLVYDFLTFIDGQTVGVNPDGSSNYYEHDVERFFSNQKKTQPKDVSSSKVKYHKIGEITKKFNAGDPLSNAALYLLEEYYDKLNALVWCDSALGRPMLNYVDEMQRTVKRIANARREK